MGRVALREQTRLVLSGPPRARGLLNNRRRGRHAGEKSTSHQWWAGCLQDQLNIQPSIAADGLQRIRRAVSLISLRAQLRQIAAERFLAGRPFNRRFQSAPVFGRIIAYQCEPERRPRRPIPKKRNVTSPADSRPAR